MNRLLLLFLIMGIFTGCAVQPQKPIELNQNLWSDGNAKLGIALLPVPAADTHEVGAGCLLCLATVAVANAELTEHVTTLAKSDIEHLDDELLNILLSKGIDTKLINDSIDLKTLPEAPSAQVDGSGPAQDFTEFKTQYDVDYLFVIKVDAIGTFRTYSGYIPTSDPQAYFTGQSYIIDLSNNTYQWYMPIRILKNAGEVWDEPPAFPGITNAYYQALEQGKDLIKAPFTADQTAAR